MKHDSTDIEIYTLQKNTMDQLNIYTKILNTDNLLVSLPIRFKVISKHLDCLMNSQAKIPHNTFKLFIFPPLNDGKIQWSRKSFENVTDFLSFCHMTQLGQILSIHVPA